MMPLDPPLMCTSLFRLVFGELVLEVLADSTEEFKNRFMGAGPKSVDE